MRCHPIAAPAPGTSPARGPQLSRRRFLGLGAAAGAGLAGGSALLSACAGTGRESIRFVQNKPEVIAYFTAQAEEFNRSQSLVRVTHDSSPTSIVAQVVRGAPPDIALYNYNLETGVYVGRGVLTDLSDAPGAARIDPAVQALVDQYATYEDQTNVLPYSVAAAGVIYNIGLFEKHDVTVPTTWSELIEACRTFQKAGVVPVYGTYKETWTASQGIWDYVTGGMVDVAGFFGRLKEAGPDVGPGTELSFTDTFGPAVERIVELAKYGNPDAAAKSYYDGNLAFGRGNVAMYLQGPWALGEIAKVDPDLRVGTFALPATDDPADTKCRVNLDLALWIPVDSDHHEASRGFLDFLTEPERVNAYNTENLAYSPLTNPPPVTDARIEGLQPLVRDGRFYQGAGTYVPTTIPLANYLQELLISGDTDRFLDKLDNDWARLAQRTA
jgi:raffinose/stachyose/melibiose transport system substrate-binding protein